ncbi:MAG TPA: lysylphosphatidylglycerol synthase transmembrane domain-containing protein, partial [Steroidobacteraceae bacterium]|nr:lysylphosphatidylglycerol synthase transmembrane domain-containing protein [Steroidobacteraceae bacterium]
MKLALQLAISAITVALLLIYVVDVRQVAHALQSFSPAYALLAILVATIDRAMMSYKWGVLLRAQGYRLGALQGMTIYCAAMLWGSALPATVGADAVRAVLATRYGIKGTDAIASIVVERVVGFVWALALGLVCLLILRSAGVLGEPYDLVVLAAVGMLLGAIGVVAVSMNRSLMIRAGTLLPAAAQRSRFMHVFSQLGRAYQSLGAARSTIAKFSALTVLEQLFAVTLTLVLAAGLAVDADPLVLFAMVPVAMLISRLPISFDGLGIFEAVFVAMFLL